MIDEYPGLSHDSWYDGSLRLWQPRKGFRATTDAVLLAAAVPAKAGTALELGAGAGAACLALACRLPQIRITAVEGDPLMADLLVRNIEENGYADRIEAVNANIFDAAGSSLWRGRRELVFMNPPYNDAGSSLSSDASRRDAMAEQDLSRWIRLAAGCLEPKGRLVMISRSDRLPEILEGLSAAGAGEVVVRPVHSLPGQPAIRVLLAARKGVRGPLALLAPLLLDDGKGSGSSREMQAVSHGRAAIDMAHPARGRQRSGEAGSDARPGLNKQGHADRKKA